MSSCEKCWRDAHAAPGNNVADAYRILIDERRNNPCTPEEQAGEEAEVCPFCGRKTLHQFTGECMAGCERQMPLQEESAEMERHLREG